MNAFEIESATIRDPFRDVEQSLTGRIERLERKGFATTGVIE
jgi:hypothetical protein